MYVMTRALCIFNTENIFCLMKQPKSALSTYQETKLELYDSTCEMKLVNFILSLAFFFFTI